MKITAFLGSPRADGNTDILAQEVLAGAAEAGWETEAIALRRLNIHPCNACEKCWANAKPCVINDDMTKLYDVIGGSDALLFATPVYWYAPTAIMKAFMDRLIPLNRPEGRLMVKGRRAILVTAYEEEGPAAAEPLIRMFELSFGYLGLQLVDCVAVDGVGPKGAVLSKPDALVRAREAARKLVAR